MDHQAAHKLEPEGDAPRRPVRELTAGEAVYLVEAFKGLGVTFRHFIKNLFNRRELPTVSYPEEKRDYGERFRGRHVLNLREDGTTKCVACMMCATICPARCIEIVAEESPTPAIEKRPKSFVIDGLRCVMCGFCVDACPCDAIYMTGEYDFAEYAREDFLWDLTHLTRRPSLADAPRGYRPRIE